MTSDDRALLDLARRAVEAAARGDPDPEPTNPGGALRERGAAFVTLKARGALRGCMGHVRAVLPLWRCVRDMARAAAVEDPRFPPLRPEELDGLSIEVSILSPAAPIEPSAIEAGRHGLLLESPAGSGLLLPQVATEWGWDAREFLRRTYEKAGLRPGDPGVRLSAFTVRKFGDAGPDPR